MFAGALVLLFLFLSSSKATSIGVFLSSDAERDAFSALLEFYHLSHWHVEFMAIRPSNRIVEQICRAHVRGMLALFLPNEFPYDFLAANFADTIGIPYFRLAPRSLLQQFEDSAVDLFPDFRTFGTAALGFLKHQRWHNVVLLQRTAEEFTEIQNLVTESYFIEHLKVTPKVLPSEGDYGPILKRLKIQMNARNIVVHTEPRGLPEVLREANMLGMCSKDFSYVLTHPDATLLQMEGALWARCNITAFSMVDYFSEDARRIHEFLSRAGIISSASKYTIPLHLAVWSDTIRLLNHSLHPIGYPDEQRSCEVPFSTGRAIREAVLRRSLAGLSGPVALGEDGRRANQTIQIVIRRNETSFDRFCQWDTAKQRLNFDQNVPTRMEGKSTSIRNKTLKVTIYLEEPFVMVKEEADRQNLTGNERYEGYLIDLLQRIAEVRGFRYVLHEVRDKSYGVKEAHGKWNGMVGELQSGEADLAVASLTISYSRSEVIDFTVPYMHLGISILFKKPEETHPSLFAFLSPLSVEVWISMTASYIVTSAAIWLLAKISPYESLREVDDGAFVECPNQFTLFNSFWFTVSSLMQQGCDLSPRAGSTRLGAAFWWLFTLIFISSYTANLAAFLTAQRMVSPIESADDLAEQTKIKYGTLGRGSTMTFFNESKIDIYEKMWKTMTSQPGLFVNSSREGIDRVLSSDYAYLMESSMLEYAVERNCQLMQIGGLLDQKGYGIGLPKGSPYREPISTAILRLQETTVLTELKEKWWKKKRGGGICNPQKATQTELGARSVGGIFIVLLVGLLVAIFASAFELIRKATAQAQSSSVFESAWNDVKKSFDERKTSRPKTEPTTTEAMEASDAEIPVEFVPLHPLRVARPVEL